MFRIFSAIATLFAFWVLLSGYFTPFLLMAGLGSAMAVAWFSQRLAVIDREGHPIHLGLRIVSYWAWLLKEIVKSGWDVSRIIVHPKLPISPTMVEFKPSQADALGLVIHANSITLTPGTIAIEATHGRFLVHGLSRAAALGCVNSEMDRRVTACEEQP